MSDEQVSEPGMVQIDSTPEDHERAAVEKAFWRNRPGPSLLAHADTHGEFTVYDDEELD